MSTDPSPAPRRYPKGEARRTAILEAALEVFATAGYRTGGLREVAAKAGLTHAGVRHYFPTKLDLLHAVLGWRDEQAIRRMSSSEDPLEVLSQWIEAARYNQGAQRMVELQVTLAAEATSSDHPLHEYLRERYEFAVAFLRDTFTALQTRGDLVAGVDPESAARTLIALTDGVQTQWLLNRDGVDMVALVREEIQRFLTVEI